MPNYINKILFEVIEFGNRDLTPIVFLHGFMGSAQDWSKITPEFTVKYNPIAISLPGHGTTKSDFPDNIFDIEHTCLELKALIESMNISSLILVGYSMGGRVAATFATMFPSLIMGLVLESTTLGIISQEERNKRIESDKILADRIMSENPNDFLKSWYSAPLFANLNQANDFDELLNMRSYFNKSGLIKSLEYAGTGRMKPLWDIWNNFKFPLLLIAGELDDKYVEINKNILNHRYNAILKIIPNVGHNTHFESPEIFIKYVKEFITQL